MDSVKFKEMYFVKLIHTISLSILIMLASCQEMEKPMPDSSMDGTTDMEEGSDDEDSEELVAAPDFSLTSLAGPTIKLSDYSGKVVVLFFFGYNCPFCISSAPTIQEKISQPYTSITNFAIFGLDQWNGNKAGVQAFKNTTKVTFPLLMNAAATATAYDTTYDRLIVIDKEGNIAFRANEPAENSIDSVEKLIKELL